MKERPFNAKPHELRSLLDGTKTQYRRLVKLPHQNPLGCWEVMPWGGPNGGRTCDGDTVPFQNAIGHSRTGEVIGCPYGQPGDRQWVREGWADLTATHGRRWETRNPLTGLYDRGVVPFAWYRADGEQPDLGDFGSETPMSERWRPSISMPRWASRITLEITGVRVERLQDISEADAIAEGIESAGHLFGYKQWRDYTPGYVGGLGEPDGWGTATSSYRSLWESINGSGSWEENPWVWVVEFKKEPRQ